VAAAGAGEQGLSSGPRGSLSEEEADMDEDDDLEDETEEERGDFICLLETSTFSFACNVAR